MTGLHEIYSSPRPITLTTADILDVDAVKTTIATVASDVSYSGADLNGADVDGATYIATPTPSTGVTDVPQYPIAVAASSAGSYVDGSTVVFTGTHGGETVQRTATVVGTDGGATFIADGPVDTVSQIDVEAQADTSGAWTFGFTDIGYWREHSVDKCFRAIRANDAGSIHVQDEDGHGDVTPFAAGEFQPIGCPRIIQATTTVTAFTIYR